MNKYPPRVESSQRNLDQSWIFKKYLLGSMIRMERSMKRKNQTYLTEMGTEKGKCRNAKMPQFKNAKLENRFVEK